MASPIELLLTDLDGVVRHFDPRVCDDLEREHGLEIGSLRREAFEHPRGLAAITGGLTRAAWTEEVGAAAGSMAAARTWLGTWGRADSEMAALVTAVRAAGVQVAVLTNGTDTIHRELEAVGLSETFDAVFCSWHIGVAKPDRAVFEHVADATGVPPGRTVFVDDTPANVAGAAEAGLRAHDFVGVDALRSLLVEGGVALG